jgi:hypothetical protein
MFLPENIDFAESKKYILSIRLMPSGFYFSIHCPSDKTVFYQNSVSFSPNSDYLKNLEKLIFDYSFFSYNYQQINVICVEEQATIVPNEYHQKKSEHDLISFNFLYPKEQVLNNEIEQLGCRVVWGMNMQVHNFLSRALLNPRFASHLSVLISLFYSRHNSKDNALFINFNDDRMIDIVAFSGENLLLAKTFYANNPLEESYYIQKTWEALQLNTQTDPLYLSGKTDNHSESIETMKKIVSKTVNLSLELPKPTKINKEEVPTEILHQLCEL